MILKSVIILIFSLILTKSAFAGFTVGVSFNHLNINDSYEYSSNYNPSLNVGYNYLSDYGVFTLTTNRLLNNPVKRKAEKGGVVYQSKSKITADTLSYGWLFGRFIPAAFVSNVKADKSLYYQSNLLGETSQTAILYGINLTYFVTSHISFNGAFIAHNRELDLQNGFVLGANYNF